MSWVKARGLSKRYGKITALDGVDLEIGEGRVVGLIGPNGAGKSTLLESLLGLIPYEGELEVLGSDPWRDRDALMREVCFIADVAVLPRWLHVRDALDYMAGVHPRFDRATADRFLARTTIRRESRVGDLSKGMVVQLHLALVMAVDAKLLVLDEPTLGLDVIFRKRFYDSLINDFFDGTRTIIVSTHEIDEIQHVLTDVVILDRGRVALDCAMDTFETRFLEVTVGADRADAARALKPIAERSLFGRTTLAFDGVERARLEALGDVRTASLSDVFIALAGDPAPEAEAAA